MNYYNEFDPKAAAWLRQLIIDGVIPNGHVDDRSITEVDAKDLEGYTQCHFFAGIGGWSQALKLAGWSSDRPVWTASLPCQPFSTAGKQLGQKDERHLWPVFFTLVEKLRPERIFGEQVARAIGFDWLDGIQADLEKENYTTGAGVLGAHSIGAPHIRQRLYWVAARGLGDAELHGHAADQIGRSVGASQVEGGLQQSEGSGSHKERVEYPEDNGHEREGAFPESQRRGSNELGERGNAITVADPTIPRLEGAAGESIQGDGGRFTVTRQHFILCRDGKARRTEPSIQPLVNVLPRGVVYGSDPVTSEYANATGEARAVRLKGYGNAIVPELAAEFITAFEESTNTQQC